MVAARVGAGRVHVARESGLRAGCRRRRRATARRCNCRASGCAGSRTCGQRGERGEAVPVGGGIAAVDRVAIVEAVVADRHELRVEIGDMAVGIGIDRVVGRIGLERRHLHVAGEIARLGPQPALLERRDRPVHQRQRDPAPALGADDRAVMGGVGGEGALASRPSLWRTRSVIVRVRTGRSARP